MITKEEVRHIAELARLKLGEEEAKTMQSDLASILGYVEKLKEVDIDGVKPTFYPVTVENIMREDYADRQSPNVVKALIEAVPLKKGNYVKVKSILKGHD